MQVLVLIYSILKKLELMQHLRLIEDKFWTNQNKNYRTEISNKELLNGYYWNKKSKQIQHLSEKNYMVKSGTNINLTRDECKQYTSKLEL
ncbi:hypothetical protein BpHYR1_024851 [Brachionus plicatilis]|uniref:Uncharacterized protein n=1 Tax=Brachionus plicatilis TaxID=10195 RepID=A0A3M7QVX5_BRAPC|nr:hypothetical protein BpHYR1_024851 [Brachionus plicatilis]